MNQSTYVSGEGTLADRSGRTVWATCPRALMASAFILGARVPAGAGLVVASPGTSSAGNDGGGSIGVTSSTGRIVTGGLANTFPQQ